LFGGCGSKKEKELMGMNQKFSVEKAVEILLYIAAQVPDTYTALKVLYFADKEHLSRYGRLISGDNYVAMRAGPVPSGTYDIIKHARGDGFCWADTDVPITEAFEVQGYNIVPLREPDLELLSDSDIECLDMAIEKYGHLSFSKLKRLSHDAACKSADRNDFISLEAIVKTLPNSDLLLDYIQGN
jgi:uncharacterized phage-associated protein